MSIMDRSCCTEPDDLPCGKGTLEISVEKLEKRINELEAEVKKLIEMYISLSNYAINIERRLKRPD